MLDEEIINALECCIVEVECENCPLYDNDAYAEDCPTRLLRLCADLINRQKAEIERLVKGCGIITEEDENWYPSPLKTPEEIKAEAVKEFAERLKENKIDIDVSFGYGREVYTEAVAVIEIDNLVKEMVGENK